MLSLSQRKAIFDLIPTTYTYNSQNIEVEKVYFPDFNLNILSSKPAIVLSWTTTDGSLTLGLKLFDYDILDINIYVKDTENWKGEPLALFLARELRNHFIKSDTIDTLKSNNITLRRISRVQNLSEIVSEERISRFVLTIEFYSK